MNDDIDDNLQVTVTELVANEGTIVLFAGHTEDGTRVTFGCDHRMAGPLAEAVMLDQDPVADVPPWSVLGSMS
jgi:hypothetical protein